MSAQMTATGSDNVWFYLLSKNPTWLNSHGLIVWLVSQDKDTFKLRTKFYTFHQKLSREGNARFRTDVPTNPDASPEPSLYQESFIKRFKIFILVFHETVL